MTIESTEELRARLLRDQEVQEMIRMRAFEIYRHRGGAPGGHAEDWFQAESEVLHFLIEEESRRVVEVEIYTETITPIEIETVTASEAEAATASEPALAPEPQVESVEAAPKKPRARKAKANTEDAAQGAAKKTTTRRAATKKPADSTAKPKRSRKKSTDSTPTE